MTNETRKTPERVRCYRCNKRRQVAQWVDLSGWRAAAYCAACWAKRRA